MYRGDLWSALEDHDDRPARTLGAPGRRTLTASLPPSRGAIQRKASIEVAEPTPTAATGAGQHLAVDVRAQMEQVFGTDFSAVRVHESPRAAALGATAYAEGNDLHFAPGRYAPDTHAGRELLGHELAHVVQQASGRVAATAQAHGVALNDDESLEREADRAGAQAARGEVVELGGGGGGAAAAAIQRARIEVADAGLGGGGRRELAAAAVERAEGLIDAACTDLDYILRTDDEDGAFARWFGASDDLATAVATVRGIYQTARAALANVRVLDHVNSMGVEADAGTHAHSTHNGPIYLCETFWGNGALAQGLTMLHEATHVGSDTEDDTGFGEPRALARAADGATARNCAYNYEHFARAGDLDLLFPDESSDEDSVASDDGAASDGEVSDGEVDDGEVSDDDDPQAAERASAYQDELRFVAELNQLSADYLAPDTSARRKQHLARRWHQIERLLFHRWGMNAQIYTLWLDVVAIGTPVPAPQPK